MPCAIKLDPALRGIDRNTSPIGGLPFPYAVRVRAGGVKADTEEFDEEAETRAAPYSTR